MTRLQWMVDLIIVVFAGWLAVRIYKWLKAKEKNGEKK